MELICISANPGDRMAINRHIRSYQQSQRVTAAAWHWINPLPRALIRLDLLGFEIGLSQGAVSKG